MSEGFETKKVAQETLGEYLYSIRQHLGLTIEEVGQKTGIFEKFISALEEGKYQVLPPDVYVLGFLKKMAELYRISCEDITEQFKKEKGITLESFREKITPKKGWQALVSQISITPAFLTIASGLVLGVGAFAYILFQALSVNHTPSLTILEPRSDTVLQGSSVVVKGKTEPGITVSVNSQNVLVQSDGSFETTLGVAPGQKDVRFGATNRFGKQKHELVSLRIDDVPKVAGEATSQPSEIVLELKFKKATTISIKRDGQSLSEELVPSGATKKIVAQDDIEVTTSDAGSTEAVFNGNNFGVLGKAGQTLTIPFNREANEFVKENNPSATTKKILN
ncbi:DUF4115 domain-containing protein [bacterium]|nr:MAG: DUF4115 domain-containing protein [bacterium]